jgi:secreted PhoX family phosphatase
VLAAPEEPELHRLEHVGLTRREVVRLGALAVVGGSVGFGSRLLAAGEPPSTYGGLLPADDNGLRLAPGFRSRVIGRTGELVAGTTYEWHRHPDGAGCVAVRDGGWILVSNSEVDGGGGGAGAVRFAADGTIVDAYTIASGTSRNCSGGFTAWGTWLSCEEVEGGRVHECDPTGAKPAAVRLGLGTFKHEAAAEDPRTGVVYMTEDLPDGRLYRFVPEQPGSLTAGRLQAASARDGRVHWVDVTADEPARGHDTTGFESGEGVVVDGPSLLVTTKGDDRVWEIGLDTGAISVLYDGNESGGVLSGVDQLTVHPYTRDVFVAEDGGDLQLVQVAFRQAGTPAIAPFLQFVGHERSEVTGPAFSPDGSRLYVTSQRGVDGVTGLTVEITGPFERWPGTATVSGRWRARRADRVQG